MINKTPAEALASVNDSVVVLTYGPAGVGKTVDSGYAFPNALFIAAPGSLYSIGSVVGHYPEQVEVQTLMEATKIVQQIGKNKTHKAVVIDDFSHLCEKTFSHMENVMRFTGFKLWGELRDAALEFREAARYAKIDVVLSCWEQAPKVKDGQKMRGGPLLAGRLPEQIPAMCDVVLRAVHEPRRKPWPVVYRCNADPNYVMKDRLDVAVHCDPVPMNLGELLRAGGREVPRLYEAQEARVETLSQMFSGSSTPEDLTLANSVFTTLLEAGLTAHEARWTVRDALDRSVIRWALSCKALNFYDASNQTRLV
jgi:hypothetical protein